ncbi:MAG: hypothetical protein GY910_02205 [bacterium]|nr:hypothetical protein [Deltaproteobacteria bacterium]MCP4903767.1 hypothetical protein [bacterium]
MSASEASLDPIRERIRSELREPVRPAVSWLAGEIAARHGRTVLGVLFYGSCLRKETDEGVLDFWVVVDDYRLAYAHPVHAWINPIAAPNVFFLEREFEHRPVRTKYGVISRSAFERGTSLAAWHPYVWARFAQPTRLLACRDDEARHFFEQAIGQAILTLVGRLVCHLPNRGGLLRFSLPAFWREAFRQTYDSERRPETESTIRDHYLADEERYDAVAAAALHHLTASGHFDAASEHPRSFSITISPGRLSGMRMRWRAMRAYSRLLGLTRLLKTAFTFGDWVPYVLWKLERHTGRKIDLSPRQRRHPLIFAWPIILPLLLRRNLR